MIRRFLGIAVLVAGAAPAVQAQGMYDPVQEIFEVIGITQKEKPHIEYRERAPLVVPPDTKRLRTPETAAGARNPQWPQDPDVLARRRKAEEARAPVTIDSDNAPRQGGVVRGPDGQVRNRYAGVPTGAQAPNASNSSDRQALMLTPQQVQQILATHTDDKPLQPGQEPDRNFLTEPPKGYRRAAAGAPVKATVEPMRDQGDGIQINALRPSR